MSDRIFQNVIVQLKDATDRILGVMDPEGIVISCSDTSLLGERWPEAALKVGSSLDAMVSFEGRTFKAIVVTAITMNMPCFPAVRMRWHEACVSWPMWP